MDYLQQRDIHISKDRGHDFIALEQGVLGGLTFTSFLHAAVLRSINGPLYHLGTSGTTRHHRHTPSPAQRRVFHARIYSKVVLTE